MAARRWRSQREVRSQDERLARDPIAQAPQDALDSGPQLRVVVGLGDVVLGDFVEQTGLAVGGVDRREDDDRQVRRGLDLAGQGQAVDARHHQVQQDQVRPAGLEPSHRLLAVASGRHFEAVVAQLLGQDDQQVRVVVDEQDPLRPGLDHLRCLPPPKAQMTRATVASIGADAERRRREGRRYSAFGSK